MKIDREINFSDLRQKSGKQDGFALMIQLGRVCGWVVWLTPTTYIQLAGVGSKKEDMDMHKKRSGPVVIRRVIFHLTLK